MHYFDTLYIRKQNEKIIQTGTKALGDALYRNDFLNRDTPLFVLVLDIKKSLSIEDDRLRDPIIEILWLLTATDATARGGIVFAKSDGIRVFFKDGHKAMQSAVVLYHRKKEIQDKIIRAVIQKYHIKYQATPEIKESDLDYRICLCQFPQDEKQKSFDSILKNNPEDPESIRKHTDKLVIRCKEVLSRFGNKESLIISKKMYHGLTHAPLKKLFKTDEAIEFIYSKEGGTNQVNMFFGGGFYSYYDKDMVHVSFDEPEPITGIVSPNDLETAYIETYERRKSTYRSDSDPHLFTYYKLEPLIEEITTLKASVIGDINLDYVTYLERNEVKDIGKRHLQFVHNIQKSVGGKAVNMAKSLQGIREFNPILLIGKIGADFEAQHILMKLKEEKGQYESVRPLLSFSATYPTGTSISIRRENEHTSILTITDKPNANSELRMTDLESRMEEILSCDYLFISGYCLLDRRIEIVEDILKRIGKRGPEEIKVVLELSPRVEIMDHFSESEDRKDRLRRILGSVFLLVYEEDALGENESAFTRNIPYKLRLNFEETKFEEQEGGNEWKDISLELARHIKEGGRSLGLITELTAEYINSRFIKAEILLCSKSPRRFELLAPVYGKSNVHHYREATSNKFRDKKFRDESHFLSNLVPVTLEKLYCSLEKIITEPVEKYREVKTAISSDLAVVVPIGGSELKILDKPDDAPNPVEKAGLYLKTYLSGNAQSVWTCTCFIDFSMFLTSDRLGWSRTRPAEILGCLKRVSEHPEDLIRHIMNNMPGTETDEKCVKIKLRELARDLLADVHLLLYKSTVQFRILEDYEIEEYVASSEWRTKGGGYAIQGNGGYFVKSIQGSFTNIMGFPIKKVCECLAAPPFNIVPKSV